MRPPLRFCFYVWNESSIFKCTSLIGLFFYNAELNTVLPLGLNGKCSECIQHSKLIKVCTKIGYTALICGEFDSKKVLLPPIIACSNNLTRLLDTIEHLYFSLYNHNCWQYKLMLLSFPLDSDFSVRFLASQSSIHLSPPVSVFYMECLLSIAKGVRRWFPPRMTRLLSKVEAEGAGVIKTRDLILEPNFYRPSYFSTFLRVQGLWRQL